MHQLEINAPYYFDWLVIASEALNELLFKATDELFLPTPIIDSYCLYDAYRHDHNTLKMTESLHSYTYLQRVMLIYLDSETYTHLI